MAVRAVSLFVGLAVTSALAVVACKTRDYNTQGQSNVKVTGGPGCTLEIPPSLASLEVNDIFFQKVVMVERKACKDSPGPQDARGHMVRLGALMKEAGCKDEGRAFVSEQGNYQARHGARVIDVYNCGTTSHDRVWATDSGEVISFDKSTSAFVYYTVSSARGFDFVLHGNSFHFARKNELHFNRMFTHPCTQCHINGALVMKELRLPWLNWQASQQFGPESAMNNIKELIAEADREVPGKAKARSPGGARNGADDGNFIAQDMEIAAIESFVDINVERIKKIKNNTPQFFPVHDPATFNGSPREMTVKHMLKPLFCETESILASARVDLTASDSITIPVDLFLNRVLITQAGNKMSITGEQGRTIKSRLDTSGGRDAEDEAPRLTPSTAGSGAGGFKSPSTSAAAWVAFKKSQNALVPAASPSDKNATGRFPMPLPARSFIDDDFVTRLAREGVIEEKLVASVLMVDFSNPVFSKRRCELLNTIDESVTVSSAGGPAGITALVTKSIQGNSSLPGAQEYLANIQETGFAKFEAALASYNQACQAADSIASKPEDLYRLIRSKRRHFFPIAGDTNVLPNFDARFAFEGFIRDPIFPQSAQIEAGQFDRDLTLSLDANCKLRNN